MTNTVLKDPSIIEAVVEHGKYHFPANGNAVTYIQQTLVGNIQEKFQECSHLSFKQCDGKVEILIPIGEVTEERMSVIKNRIAKQMKNMSKRYNKRCYVK